MVILHVRNGQVAHLHNLWLKSWAVLWNWQHRDPFSNVPLNSTAMDRNLRLEAIFDAVVTFPDLANCSTSTSATSWAGTRSRCRRRWSSARRWSRPSAGWPRIITTSSGWTEFAYHKDETDWVVQHLLDLRDWMTLTCFLPTVVEAAVAMWQCWSLVIRYDCLSPKRRELTFQWCNSNS